MSSSSSHYIGDAVFHIGSVVRAVIRTNPPRPDDTGTAFFLRGLADDGHVASLSSQKAGLAVRTYTHAPPQLCVEVSGHAIPHCHSPTVATTPRCSRHGRPEEPMTDRSFRPSKATSRRYGEPMLGSLPAAPAREERAAWCLGRPAWLEVEREVNGKAGRVDADS